MSDLTDGQAFMSLPEGRRVSRRTEYLHATTELSEREAEAVAWSEEGYSRSGIARRMGSAESTVADYLGRVTARYGPGALGGAYGPRTGEADLEPVTAARLLGHSDGVVDLWRQYAQDHLDAVPASARPVAVGGDGL